MQARTVVKISELLDGFFCIFVLPPFWGFCLLDVK